MSSEYRDWYNDFSDHQKEVYNICMKYPFLIPRDIKGNRDEEFDYTYLSLEIPVGWTKLFLQMCSDIKPLLEKEGIMDDFYFLQVKEKYNTLRCYSNGAASQEVEDIITKYEHMAYYICTQCGSPATYETQGYWASFCEDCIQNINHREIEKIEFKTYYRTIGFAKGESYDKTISFEDEWNRYLKENGYEERIHTL
jgi:hypothetical protein